MLAAFLPGLDSNEGVMGGELTHDSIAANLQDIEKLSAQTLKITGELKKVQDQRNAERSQAAQTIQNMETRWLHRLRCARVESALRAGISARDLRAVGHSIKLWAEVVGILRAESLQRRQEREQQLQLRLRDSGRAELLREQSNLHEQSTMSALAAQRLRALLSSRTQDLERTMLRDTMAFDLWAEDAKRVSLVLNNVKAKHAASETDAREEVARLNEALHSERRAGAARSAHAEAVTAAALAEDIGELEFRLRIKAANQIVVVRLALQDGALHRSWKRWAMVASLLLREASSVLLQLELAKQQQRGAHTRLQAELAAELAHARVENLEARSLLSKAEIIDQLRPGHELVTDKEIIAEQRRALQAAHNSAAAAHLAAATHRIGEETLLVEVHRSEEAAQSVSASAQLYGSPDDGIGQSRTRLELEDLLQHERISLEFLQTEHAHTASALARADCERRILVRALQQSDAEQQLQTSQSRPVGSPRARQASPAPRGSPSGGKQPEGRPVRRPVRPKPTQ